MSITFIVSSNHKQYKARHMYLSLQYKSINNKSFSVEIDIEPSDLYFDITSFNIGNKSYRPKEVSALSMLRIYDFVQYHFNLKKIVREELESNDLELAIESLY